jgi:acyl-CoA synthetase (AMP-forming)/AMP-acid ligase II/acyl carrier protein
MVEHRNVLSLWQGLEHIYRQSASCQRVGVNASLNFDASVKQFIQLLSGRTLVLVPQGVRWDAAKFLNFIKQHRVDGIDCTPGQLKTWLSAGLLEDDGHRLRLVLVGGELIDGELWNSLCLSAETRFFNVYGPTENTVDTTSASLQGDTTTPHIGRPMENRCVYILNRQGQPAPVGVPGELYVGGAGVARGYLNRPQLTAERFVPDPFSADPNARLYKTGDLGQWRADGSIEYVGRNDHQVKIRGFRIELGEIEAQLVRHEQVRDAVVVVREDAPEDKQLVAYITSRGQSAPNVAELRERLKKALPEYMTPSAFVILQNLPLTPNGKLDRRALTAPGIEAYVSREYQEPQGEMEATLAEIWRELLHVSRVGREDNFFELGGHSILAMQVVARVQSSLSIAMPIGMLFESETLQQLAVEVDDLRRMRLLDRLSDGGIELEALLERLASMPENQVQQLIRKFETEGTL